MMESRPYLPRGGYGPVGRVSPSEAGPTAGSGGVMPGRVRCTLTTTPAPAGLPGPLRCQGSLLASSRSVGG